MANITKTAAKQHCRRHLTELTRSKCIKKSVNFRKLGPLKHTRAGFFFNTTLILLYLSLYKT